MKKSKLLKHPLSKEDIAALRSYSLGIRIQKLRACADMNQIEFGNLFGVKQTTVWAWESDEHIPRAMILNKMQLIFNLPTDFFLDAEIERVKLRKKRRVKSDYMCMWQKIEYTLLKRIIAGKYPVLSELPSTNKLADEFNSSTTTAYNAVLALLAADILIVRRGKQPLISDRAVENAKKEIEKFANKIKDYDLE